MSNQYLSFSSRNDDLHRRDIIETINRIINGRTNNKGAVTLTINSGTTTVTNPLVSSDSTITLTPMTLSASGEVGAGSIYVSTVSEGSFILTHANNSVADRTFRYAIIG